MYFFVCVKIISIQSEMLFNKKENLKIHCEMIYISHTIKLVWTCLISDWLTYLNFINDFEKNSVKGNFLLKRFRTALVTTFEELGSNISPAVSSKLLTLMLFLFYTIKSSIKEQVNF